MRDATLLPVPMDELRPTQITLGFREIAQKREQWRNHMGKDRKAFLSRHTVPTVLGPKKRHYLIDGHHLTRAVADEGIDEMMVSVVADLSALSRESFWVFLDNRSWCHPYDEDGVRRGFKTIPKQLEDLRDDPYRSLAAALRRAGGFAKDPTAFAEFLWADFLRKRIDKKAVEADFADAIVQALDLARGRDASYLPGWCGPDPIEP
jgi:hypothetical protein